MIRIPEDEINKLRQKGLMSDGWAKRLNIINMVEETGSVKRAAARYGVSVQYVYQVLKKERFKS